MRFSIRNPNRSDRISELQEYLSDGVISSSEKEEIKSNLEAAVSRAISDFRSQNPELIELVELVKGSVDSVPGREEIQEAAANLRDIIADGITPTEFNQIVEGFQQGVKNSGVTASEVYEIILQSQVVAANSEVYPDQSDSITGTNGNDLLYGLDGADTLNGAGTNFGANQTDILIGGAGSDLFVLGNARRAFYQAIGATDYALILDFDPANGDKVQLAGTASNYSLGAIPSGLQVDYPNLGGTAIFAANEELIGVLYGTDVKSFTVGFSFV